jgi:hypothetical protein
MLNSKIYEQFLLIIIILLIQSTVNGQVRDTFNIPQDTILKNTLESIRLKDQTLRLLLPDINKKFGKYSEELKYIWTLIHHQDSINEIEVENIIDNYGWLGENRVGELANQSLWLVIQHAPLNIQEKYMPLLKISVEKRESKGWYLAFLEDRILMRKGEKQIYGSQTFFNSETGKFHIYIIKDVDNVNKRRSEIGLETLEEYAKINGYIIDK